MIPRTKGEKAIVLMVLLLALLSFPFLVGNRLPRANQPQTVAYSQEDFVAQLAPTVQTVAKAYGVKPSLILAQALHQSSSGRSLLAAKYHNIFAQEAQPSDAKVTLLTTDSQSQESKSYAVYGTWEEAVYAYLANLKASNQSAFELMTADKASSEIASDLAQAGFSSDADYASSLQNLIKEHDLTQYDK